MIRSMTGFGEAERETEAGTLRVEIRTVNHRHLSVNFRTPASLAKWEPQMRDWLRAHLSRGHANVAVRLEPARSEEHTSELQSRLHLVCRLLLEKKKQG